MITGIPALLVGLALLLGLMATGMPVFVAFMIVNIVGIVILMGPSGYVIFAASLQESTTTTALVTIPLFILMGEILFRSNAVEVLLRSVDTLVGRITGRQFVVSIILATLFSMLSGAAMAVAAMMGRSLLPAMLSRGYDARLSAGNILAGASLAPLIPPSVMTIIVGTLAGVSIAGLLVAGILPGILLALMFLGYTFTKVLIRRDLAPPVEDAGAPRSAGSILFAFLSILPFGIIVFSVMGLILFGIATPNEAGAMGVLGAIVTAAIYRRLSIRMLAQSVASAAKLSAMILIILASSKLFSQLLGFTGGATDLTRWVVDLDLGYWLMLFLLLALPFVLCMFIDQAALMLIVIPIYRPMIDSMGYDPIWFWLLFLINMTVGSITPPFGYTLFALRSSWRGGTLRDIYAAAWPFVALFVLAMILVAVFPPLATFLPGLL